MKIKILLSALFVSQSCFAGLLFNYSQLALKDLDQMSAVIQDRIKESKKAGGDPVISLKEALQAVFSRPNEDGMIEKVLSPVKNALDEHNAWESSIKKLTKEALGALGNPKAFQPVVQVTYLVFLENLVAEMKPKATASFEASVLQTIQKAQIKITKEAAHERVLRMMKETRSPSELAEEALKLAVAKPVAEEKKAPTGVEADQKSESK